LLNKDQQGKNNRETNKQQNADKMQALSSRERLKQRKQLDLEDKFIYLRAS
jgi:hypothetical protein